MKWRGDNYRDNSPGCYNCKYAFRRVEYDESDAHFCTKDAPPRPPCTSVYMKGYMKEHTTDNRETAEAKWKTWVGEDWDDDSIHWRGKRYVESWGICDEWEEKTE